MCMAANGFGTDDDQNKGRVLFGLLGCHWVRLHSGIRMAILAL